MPKVLKAESFVFEVDIEGIARQRYKLPLA